MKSSLFLVIISVFLIGCGTAPTGNNAAVNSVINPVATTTATPFAAANDAPTLTPVYLGFCNAFLKKDEAGIRKAYAAETMKSIEADMKAENIKSLMKALELDGPIKGGCSVKNEEIKGDRAVATIVSDRYPNGFAIVFVKENGEWKMTTQSPTFKSMPANTAK